MSIEIPAFVDMCTSCEGVHGRIVMSTGDQSREFCSKSGARAVVMEHFCLGQIDLNEKLFLLSVIEGLNMAEDEEDADFLGKWVCDVVNVANDGEVSGLANFSARTVH